MPSLPLLALTSDPSQARAVPASWRPITVTSTPSRATVARLRSGKDDTSWRFSVRVLPIVRA